MALVWLSPLPRRRSFPARPFPLHLPFSRYPLSLPVCCFPLVFVFPVSPGSVGAAFGLTVLLLRGWFPSSSPFLCWRFWSSVVPLGPALRMAVWPDCGLQVLVSVGFWHC